MAMKANPVLSRRAVLRSSALFGVAACLPSQLAFAAGQQGAAGQGAAESWPSVSALLDRYVGERKLPGAIATLGWGDRPLSAIARGNEAFDDADAVSAQSLFRVYSMTKPVTGMAAMMLIEDGKLGLDAPLADYAPEFAQMQVALDPQAGLESRPAVNVITIRHLLTHTAGFGYGGLGRDKPSMEMLRLGLAPGAVSRMEVPGLGRGVPVPGPDEFLRRAAGVPLLSEPGSRWSYSIGIDILGIVIQRVSGAKSLAAFLDERMFGPAGMRDTFFRVPDGRESRLATNYGVVAGIPVPIDKPADTVFRDEPPFAFGGAGLVTTPADYDRFLQMLVGRGTIGGKRVMAERAVALGLSNLLPAGAQTAGTIVEGAGFGAGGRVGLGREDGTFGWFGAAGTAGFINARIGLRSALYVQFMPPGVYPIQKEFTQAVLTDVMAGAGRR